MASDVNGGLAGARLTFKKKQLINGHSTTISDHFFTNCMLIFHKTKIQTVILRCSRSLNLNWYNSYDKKRKKAKNANEFFEQNCKKTKLEIFAFCVITFEPIRF